MEGFVQGIFMTCSLRIEIFLIEMLFSLLLSTKDFVFCKQNNPEESWSRIKILRKQLMVEEDLIEWNDSVLLSLKLLKVQGIVSLPRFLPPE